MPELSFRVLGAESGVVLRLAIANRPADEAIAGVALRCQVRIDSARRRYTAAEQSRLYDLFGEPERWGETLRPLLWRNVAMSVPAFSGSTEVALALPRRMEAEEAAGKYFGAIDDGVAELSLLFSGTVYYEAGDRLQVAPIPWSSETRWAMPAEVWRD